MYKYIGFDLSINQIKSNQKIYTIKKPYMKLHYTILFSLLEFELPQYYYGNKNTFKTSFILILIQNYVFLLL